MSDACPHCSNTIHFCLCDEYGPEERGEWIDQARKWREAQLEAQLAEARSESEHLNGALDLATKFWRQEAVWVDTYRDALQKIADGEVDLGRYSEMIQAVQVFAQDVLDG